MHLEAESESDKKEEVGEKEGSGSSEQGAMLQTSRVQLQLQTLRKKKGEKTTIHLADLFFYPWAPPGYNSLSDAEKQLFDASDDGDHLWCLCFIWRMGKVQYLNEQHLTETLQHDGRTEA